MLKSLIRKVAPNPLDRLLKKSTKRGISSILIVWNRGLGDIALGLYALVFRIRSFIPHAEITFVTRKDLEEGFLLLEGIKTIICPTLKRYTPYQVKDLGLDLEKYDLILEKPDPTYWLHWQIGKLQPKLKWNSTWDELTSPLSLPKETPCAAFHVHSETTYGYEKNWPVAKWHELFSKLENKNLPCILLGNKTDVIFPYAQIIDLRGKTSLLQVLSLLKNACRFFVGPDSGILSLLYYLEEPFALKAISLWADPNQGILKQKVPSPNSLLEHIPLIAPGKLLKNLEVDEVLSCLH